MIPAENFSTVSLTMERFGLLNLTIFALYAVGMLAVGFWFARRQTTATDYFLAGRRMPWIPVAMSMYASATSASTFLGLPGIGFSMGLPLLVVCIVSPLLAPLLAGVMYPAYRRLNCTTSYEYIGIRFGQGGRYAVSTLFVLARISWLGIVVFMPALALSIATGMPINSAILVIGLLATAYTVLGGLTAVIWTDVIQFVILIGGAAWAFLALVHDIPGGFSGMLSAAAEAGHANVWTWSLSWTEMTTISILLCFALQMLQEYGTDQLSVQRMLAVSSTRGAVKATIFNAFTDIIMISMLLLIGLSLFVYYSQNPGEIGNASGDSVFPHYIITQLPPGVSGLIISAIFAAAMSSLDSGINSIATVIEHDLLKPLQKRHPSDAGDVRIARVMTAALGLAAIAMAFYVSSRAEENIIQTFATFMSLFNAPVLGLFLLGMTSRKNRFGGWLVGAAVAIPTTYWLQQHTELNWTWYFPYSFAVSFGTGWLVSRLRPAPGSQPASDA